MTVDRAARGAPAALRKTLSLMPTWRCTAECTDCGTGSSPRERTTLHSSHLERAIREAAESDYAVVVFTGGEATLLGATLNRLVRMVGDHGMTSRLVTNGYWALSTGAADRRVSGLVQAGLHEINFSTGDEHARFVPLERLLSGVRAAVRADLPTTVMVETKKQRVITARAIEEHEQFVQLRADFPHRPVALRESPWMPLDPERVEIYDDQVAVDRTNVSYRKGCDSILTTTTVQADGVIAACCGLGMRDIPELQVGHVTTTSIAQADARARDDFLKHWLRVEGPERILAWAASHDPSIVWEGRYGHRCQSCVRLFADATVRDVVRQHHTEKMADVVAAEYLLFHHPDVAAADR